MIQPTLYNTLSKFCKIISTELLNSFNLLAHSCVSLVSASVNVANEINAEEMIHKNDLHNFKNNILSREAYKKQNIS